MHTHYDNLKVSRDAPPEVIRAAYKSLSQKYHPDRHADGEEANRIMRLLNVAYDVLSDPARRAEHDQWISTQEKIEAEQRRRRAQAARPDFGSHPGPHPARAGATGQARPQGAAPRQPQPSPQPETARPSRKEKARSKSASRRAAAGKPGAPLPRSWSFLLYAGIGAAIVVLLGEWSPPGESATERRSPQIVRPAQAAPVVRSSASSTPLQEAKYVRPGTTPRGLPWPARSGYLVGYPVLNSDGLSSLTVDNTRSESDVFLKLVAIDGGTPVPVRTSFVRGGSSFTMENIAPGSYDVRYRSLDTGEIFRSERFHIEEINETDGTSFANNILTLYSVPGKSRSVTIPEREFP